MKYKIEPLKGREGLILTAVMWITLLIVLLSDVGDTYPCKGVVTVDSVLVVFCMALLFFLAGSILSSRIKIKVFRKRKGLNEAINAIEGLEKLCSSESASNKRRIEIVKVYLSKLKKEVPNG